jgi:hypothetical protein
MAGDSPAARLAVNAALELQPDHAASLALAQELGTRQGTLAAATEPPRALVPSPPLSQY